MIEFFKLIFGLVRSFFRRDLELILGNLALRHRLQIVLRSHPRLLKGAKRHPHLTLPGRRRGGHLPTPVAGPVGRPKVVRFAQTALAKRSSLT
jgi:hypothetical protein